MITAQVVETSVTVYNSYIQDYVHLDGQTQPTYGSNLSQRENALIFYPILSTNRPIRLTQCCTQFESPGVKIHCVLYLHHNVAFSFKCMEIPETKSFIPKGFELGTTLS